MAWGQPNITKKNIKYISSLQVYEFKTHTQRLGRQNRHMGLWPLAFKSYGPFLKSMGHGSNGMGQKFKKRNIGILVRDVTFDSVYHIASCS